MPDSAMRTTPNTAKMANEPRPLCPPANNHSTRNCSSSSNKTATRLARSQRPSGGTILRSGSTNQSVRAKIKLPNGLPDRLDMGMR